jgi:hypothetical protein
VRGSPTISPTPATYLASRMIRTPCHPYPTPAKHLGVLPSTGPLHNVLPSLPSHY